MHLLVIVVVYVGMFSDFATTDNRKFAERIQEFADDLGINSFQDYLDREVQYTDSAIVGSERVKMVADSLSMKFQQRIEIVESLRNSLEQSYDDNTFTHYSKDCCSITITEYDHSFNEKTNRGELCALGQGMSQMSSRNLPGSILNLMKANLRRVPSIKLQYYGSEEGILFRYPAGHTCTTEYDPRFRPWYVDTATAIPKDVVIVLDRSGSMRTTHRGRSLLNIAKEAATTVIKTLNPNDRVGVVEFSTDSQTPSGRIDLSTCYQSHLAFATPQNKHYLAEEFVAHLTAVGSTHYIKALRKAFSFFSTSDRVVKDTHPRGQVILFLTDGRPIEDKKSILEALADENSKLGNKVVVMTYGLGTEVDLGAQDILRNMALQMGAHLANGDITPGIFKHVSNASNLRKAMGSYYSFFSKTGRKPQVTFSVPYKDAFGLGLITSACLPVYHRNILKGVTCVDITMEDLLADVTYFREGKYSYAILIDQKRRTLMHPLLPAPINIYDEPIFIDLTVLERSTEAEAITSSMQRGESGNSTLYTRRVFSKGNTEKEGVYEMKVLSDYYWEPVEGTGFSLCLVVGKDDHQAKVVWNDNYPESFLYHRIDLKSVPGVCNYFERLVVKDKTSVMLAARAFQYPYKFLNSVETLNDVNRYELFMTGAISKSTDFKDGVRESVAITARFEELMFRKKTHSLSTVWTYIGMEDGTFRIFPAHRGSQDYDPTLRPWYKRAMANKNLLTVSVPYMDASGAGFVISLSKVIYEGKSTEVHDESDVPVGVMSIDVTVTHFYQLLVDSTPECQQLGRACFIMDISGYIVVHKDFIELETPKIPKLEYVHVTTKEHYIAQDLIRRRYLVRSACINVEAQKEQYFHRVNYDATVRSEVYDMNPLPGTNIFIVIKKIDRTSQVPCYCTSQDVYMPKDQFMISVYLLKDRVGRYGQEDSNRLPKCLASTQTKCQCPCLSKISIYDYCADDFHLNSDVWPLCTPQPPPTSVSSIVKEEKNKTDQVEQCNKNYNCKSYSSNSLCRMNAKCSWCYLQTSGSKIQNPYCDRQSNCYFGIEGREMPRGNGKMTPEPTAQPARTTIKQIRKIDNTGAVIAGVTVCAVVVTILIAITVCVVRKKRNNPSDSTRPSTTRQDQGTTVNTRETVSSNYTNTNSPNYGNDLHVQSIPTSQPGSGDEYTRATPSSPPYSYSGDVITPPPYYEVSHDNRAFEY